MVSPEIVPAGPGNMTVTKVGFEILPAAERRVSPQAGDRPDPFAALRLADCG